MNAHLVKPLDGPQVIETIKQFLANKILKSEFIEKPLGKSETDSEN